MLEMIQPTTSDKLLDFIIKFDVVLNAIAVIMVVKAILALATLIWLRPHTLHLRKLLPYFHEHLHPKYVQKSVVHEHPQWRQAPP